MNTDMCSCQETFIRKCQEEESSQKMYHISLYQEWRNLGVQQSRGWMHYELHKPEPHILLFRRPKGTDPQTGLAPTGFIAPPDTYAY